MYLYGKNSVYERLKNNPKSIRNILISNKFSSDKISVLIEEKNIKSEHIDGKNFPKRLKQENTQGIAALISKYKYTPLEDILETKDTLIMLDRVSDPHNLGSLIRTAACFGNTSIIIPKHKSCEINETVLRVAQGGENYVKICQTSNLTNAIIKAKKNNYWIAGTDTRENAQNIYNTSLPFPLGIILGSEGSGIRYGLTKHIDLNIYIPMPGASLSLNVTIAGAILCYEITKQKNQRSSNT